jgi:hypothetical protein
MKGSKEGPESADSSARARGRRRDMTRMRRRSGAVAAMVAAAALSLAACGGGSSTPQVASLAKGSSTGGSHGGGSTTAAAPKGNATKLVDEWAACERSHGDVNQADPVIDIHDVINITLPGPGQGGMPVGDPHDATGECSQYLVAAQIALRKADPVQDPLGVTNTAVIVKFASCMRANGVPDYPYPSGPNDSETDFLRSGVNPNSPQVIKVNDLCGKKLSLPLWWVNGWGQPGDIAVSMAGVPSNPPACIFAKQGCPVGTPGGGAVSGSNG